MKVGYIKQANGGRENTRMDFDLRKCYAPEQVFIIRIVLVLENEGENPQILSQIDERHLHMQ